MADFYQKLNEFRSLGKDVVLVTVTEKDGMAPSDVGKKMLVSEDNQAFGTIGGGTIEYYAREKCKEVLKSRESFSEKYVLTDQDINVENDTVVLPMACGGKVTLFYEFLGPKQYVYIFGGGHCGAALAKVLKPLGFYTTIIDYRQDVIDALDDSADVKFCQGFIEYLENHRIPDNRYVVVSTPSHTYDFDVLDKIFELGIKPKYFGMLCSKKKIGDYLKRLEEKYRKVNLDNFYSPIGLPTGGDSPEEVAISIASEILSIYYGKDKKISHLRDSVPEEIKYFK
ncbi:MAG: XdhC family protein [Bacilli bacterium]|nr:XdhC family protein [Bacilli bacterium]